jgi:cytochrome c
MNISALTLVSSTMLLAACVSSTNTHMKHADRYLAESEFKASQGDWLTAISLVQQVHEQVTAAVHVMPVRRGLGGSDVDLRTRLEEWSNAGSGKLLASLKSKSVDRTHAAYTSARLQCVSCHTALGKSEIEITNWPAP